VNDILSKISPKVIESICKLKGNWSLKDTAVTRFNYDNLLINKRAKELNVAMLDKALHIESLPEVSPMMQSKVPDPLIDVPLENSQLLYDYSRLQEVAKEHVNKLYKKDGHGNLRRRG
jgi:hypothetical protein